MVDTDLATHAGCRSTPSRTPDATVTLRVTTAVAAIIDRHSYSGTWKLKWSPNHTDEYPSSSANTAEPITSLAVRRGDPKLLIPTPKCSGCVTRVPS